MPLIDLKTNLKDLKFGHDEYKGASSNEPYIQTRIPATDEPLQTGISNAGPVLASIGAGAAIGAIGGSILGSAGTGAVIGAAAGLGIGIIGTNATTSGFRLPSAGTGGPDFLIRGGSLFPNILIDDGVRLTKYFASTEGILFTVKQNLLSRMGTRAQGSTSLLNERLYTPISTLLGAVGNPFGLHVNKQGLNPLLGVGDPYTPDRYFEAVSNEIKNSADNSTLKQSNLLVGLYSAIFVGENKYSGVNDINFRKRLSLNDSNNILSYSGGPGSFLGIGRTNIRYATDNTGAPLSININPDPSEQNKESGTNGDFSSYSTLGFTQLSDIYEKVKTQQVVDFRKELRITTNTIPGPRKISYSPGSNKTIEQRVYIGDPGDTLRNKKYLDSYTNGAGFGAASVNSFDKINAVALYQSEGPQSTTNNPDTINDLVRFRIGVINNDSPSTKTYIHFRAFLDQISDNYSADWQASKYIGRGENFYTYSGFDRKVSLSWTVVAQSKLELIPMYKKLNYLASVCAPDYSSLGYMRGNIITLTIGGYFYEQPGIITGLSYEMNDDNSTWEIGIDDEGNPDPDVKEMPHMIKVKGFNFIPIHEFVPRLQKNGFDLKTNYVNSYGPERYIALSAGGKTNYDNPEFTFNSNINANTPSDTTYAPADLMNRDIFGEDAGVEFFPR